MPCHSFCVRQCVAAYPVLYIFLDFERIRVRREELHLKWLILCQLTSSRKKKASESSGNKDGNEVDSESSGEGGFIAAGTDKERLISGEDANCSICLGKYKDNDDLRELSCTHCFHVECVDKWLKINASCPLCKHEIGESSEVASESAAHAGLRRDGQLVWWASMIQAWVGALDYWTA